MKKPDTVILFLAYGSDSNCFQARFCILTLYYHVRGDFDGIRIVVYTDKPDHFTRFAPSMPLTVEVMSKTVIQQYKGPLGFIHRVKACIIRDCFAKYQANIFYLDADTYVTQSPIPLLQRISPATSIMNTNDYDLNSASERFENTDWLLIRRAVKDYTYTLAGKPISIPLATRMWNAGVIGMSQQNAALVEQVIELSDQIYANKRVFTAEQFAFSYFLQNKTNLISSGDVIFHYWHAWGPNNHKHTYTYHINLFFKKHGKATVPEQTRQAFLLTQHHGQLKLPKKTISEKFLHRLKLVYLVAFKGKFFK